jgi:23S rRNA (adenine2503-C2)-methyltransferase
MLEKLVLTDLSHDEMHAWVTERGEPAFRAEQLFVWIYRSLACDYAPMSNLSVAFRQKLAETALVQSLSPLETVTSADALTVKTLFSLRDNETIEAVLMRYDGRQTVCVSTQVGCAIGCPFCATGRSGFRRNLSSGEIVDQVLHFARQLQSQGKAVTNLVLMGMGEPLANYEATWRAIRVLNDPRGFGLGARRFTISTAGLAPGIRRMATEDLAVGLAVSLHAASDDLRNRLVPLNRRFPIPELIESCRTYAQGTGRRVSFEYALIDGVNDNRVQAGELGKLLRGLLCHVNLIPVNPTTECDYRPSGRQRVMAFHRELTSMGISNTIRLERGVDIQAGCGQLRSRHVIQESSGRDAKRS